jgi:tetratricopeptide (TPR) repeat protein/predicted Ser/Thr protein kinase
MTASSTPVQADGRSDDPTPDADLEGTLAREAVRRALFGDEAEPPRIGRFVVLGRIGAGGMGLVYAAYDAELDRRVAIKVMRRSSDEDASRLEREAKAMARLSHPNVVTVHETGRIDGSLFIVMEFVRGQHLRAWAESHTTSEILAALLDAGRGLAAAHEAGLVHRDFKPDNVFVGDDGRARVGDFGLARAVEDPLRQTDDDSGGSEAPSTEHRITAAGKIVGTPAYMSPECFSGTAADAASDQFSFCVTAYEALGGRRPFAGRDITALAAATAAGRIEPPAPGANVPPWILTALTRGLSPDPSARWPSMQALLDALADRPSRRVQGGALGLGLLLAAGGTWALATGESNARCTGAVAELQDAWGDAARDAARQGLSAAGDEGPATWDRVGSELDAYAAQWRAAFTDTCEATAVRAEQSESAMDLRMECLHGAKLELAATARVLADADARVLQRAERTAESLPDLLRCADVATLRTDVPPPPAADAERIEDVRRGIADARVLERAGRYDAALAAAKAAVADVEAIGYEPLRTRAVAQLGYMYKSSGDIARALASFDEARRLAAKWGQWAELRNATTHLVFIVGLQQRRYDEALRLADVARGLLDRTPDPGEDALLRNNVASVLGAKGDYAGAEAEYRALLEFQRLHPTVTDEAMVRHNLAIVLRHLGRAEEAAQEARAAIKGWSRAKGEAHPNVATAYGTLADILAAQGRTDEAIAAHETGLGIRVRVLAPDHDGVAWSHLHLGQILVQAGRLEEAESHYRSALAITERATDTTSGGVGDVLLYLGHVVGLQGRTEEAEATFRRALQVYQDARGPDDPLVAEAEIVLGEFVAVEGRLAEGETLLQSAAEILARTQPAESSRLADARSQLGRVRLELGHPASARAPLEAAWGVRQHDPDPSRLADTAFGLALALQDVEPARARTLATKAQVAYDSLGQTAPPAAAEVEAWLRQHPS